MALTNHQVYAYDRGGRRRLFEIRNISALQWNRVRDDKSQAQITIPLSQAWKQSEQLNSLDAARHEVVIFRNGKRQWEGPIRLITYTATQVVINVNDCSDYLDTRVMHKGYSNAYSKSGKTAVDYVVNRISNIIMAELANKEALGYNILSYLRPFPPLSGDARTAMVTTPFSMTVWTHLDNLAAQNGIDYTWVGRALYIWDTSRAVFGQTPQATEADFLGPLTVSMYGAEMATAAVSTDGNGTYGVFGTDNDPYYGEREYLVTAYDASTATANTTAPSSAELKSQAQRNMNGRNPTPIILRVPDNSQVDPRGVLGNVDLLVPGVWIPVRTTNNLKTISQPQKLQTVTIKEDDKGETITVSLYPATSTAVTDDIQAGS